MLGAAVFLLFQAATSGTSSAVPALTFQPPPAGVGADSPEQAVQLFLDAEVAGDSTMAFRFLSEADRVANVSPQMWAARSPLGDLRSWSWFDTDSLATTVQLEPGLSLTKGWSPASTSLVWQTVNEDGWRISLVGSVADPVVPDPNAAPDAAQAWLNDASRCVVPGDARLALAPGSPTFDRLCTSGGVMAIDDSYPVSGRVAAELELAYGPGAGVWARSVPLDGGAELVLVAIGDQWLVIDAVSP